MTCGKAKLYGLAVFGLLLTGFVCGWSPAVDPPRVTLELFTQKGFPLDGHRAWISALEKVGLTDVRIRGGAEGDALAVETTGKGPAASHRVTGVLGSDNRLYLPGGRFALGDSGRISAWLLKLRDGGEEALITPTTAFGLLPRELEELHLALAAPVTFETKDKAPRDVAQQIARSLNYPFISDPAAAQALKADERIGDEMRGLACGTVLAAALRPVGLVLVPEKAGPQVRLRITDSQAATQAWTIGYEPDQPPNVLLPDLFKYLTVEVADTPVGEAITSITDRLSIPTLIDRNSLLAQRIDLETAKVGFPRGKTFYGNILSKLLFQAKMKYELRVDENQKPFLWITSLRQTK